LVDKSHWTIETSDRVLVSTEFPIGVRPVPSPNGRYIAVYSDFSPTELRVYDTQTGKWSDLGKITIHPDGYSWQDLWPSWNPWFANSSRLAFFVGSTLVISTPDGQKKTETSIDGQAGLPVPSPDGKSIAFITAEPRPSKVNSSRQFWGNTIVWVIAAEARSTPHPVTQKSDDETYDLNWLNNNTIVFDRVANDLLYQRARIRIWKANVTR
jgi:Tol biopolymer transport system component